MSGAIESVDTLNVDNISLGALGICIRSGALCTLGTSSHMEYGSIEAHSSRSISKSWNEICHSEVTAQMFIHST